MHKEIIAVAPFSAPASGGAWIDLEACARVRLTSEDPEHPIEAALRDTTSKGWQAAQPGPQTIWFHFDQPQSIREVRLRFEPHATKTHEFVVLWSADGGVSYREMVRQQFNFSRGTPVEEEHYFPSLTNVTDLKLAIVPDIAGGTARASLRALQLR